MKILVKKDSTLLKYLDDNIDMPNKRIKQYLKFGSIYVDNVKTTKHNYLLKPGMTIVINTKNKSKTQLPFEIVFEDEYIIVVNKPAGLLSIGTAKERENTVYRIVSNYLKAKNPRAKVFVVHRLDKDTSGLVILAKSEKMKNQLQENWNTFASLREYTAVVEGHVKKEKDKIVQYLRETKTNLVYETKPKDGKEAITNFELIKEGTQNSLLKINIETGRKNQIRVAMKTINNPILGDKKYGNPKNNEKRLYLHANRLKLFHPIIKKEILFEIPIPIEFKQAVK